MAQHNIAGQRAEDLAAQYLQTKGYKIVQRNFKDKFCEIDIIATYAEFIVFIEVKYRVSSDFGGAVGAITQQKLERMKKAAEFYISQSQKLQILQPRLDVITVTGDLEKPALKHLPNCSW